MEYHGKFGHTIGRIQHIALMSIIGICYTVWRLKKKLRHRFFLVSKVSSAVFNIWLVTLINPYFILLLVMMTQMLSELHGAGIKLKNKQPIFLWNTTNMRMMLELSTEYGQFQVLLILPLVFMSSGKYILKQIRPLSS